jgi:hypothetical protein
MEKTGSCKHPNSRIGAVMFRFHFVSFGIKNKTVYKHGSFSVYKSILLVFLSSTSHHASTIAFPFYFSAKLMRAR